MGEEKDINNLLAEARKICHDLNQPLTVIMARSELMMLRTPADDSSHKAAQQLHEQAEKMSDLIDSLRALLKSYQGD